MEAPLIAGLQNWTALRESVASEDAAGRLWLGRIRHWSQPLPSEGRVVTLLDRAEVLSLRPTRDPREYVSWGTYFWLNPSTPDGFPLVHRDGQVSPEVLRYDRPITEQAFTEMIWLACRAYLREELREEGRALERLEAMLMAWFVDERTAMRPHLRHAQIVPGTDEAEGRPVGTIDFNFHIPRLLETLCLIWSRLSPGCQEGVTVWFRAFLHWLVEGEYARWLQRPERNNIGTYYDILVGTIAIHFGCREIASQRLERFTEDRVLNQVEPNGDMPAELRRTLSLSYCTMNLVGLLQAGLLCEHVGLGVFSRETESGARLRRAIASVLPSCMGEAAWPHQQIQPLPAGASVLLASLVERCIGDHGCVERAAAAAGLKTFPGIHAAGLIPLDYSPIGAWRGPSEASAPASIPAGC